MNIPLEKFEQWLKNKNLKDRTIENYIFYFMKFKYQVFDQESVSQFLSDPRNRNSNSRSFLITFQKFLTVNWRELGISESQRNEAIEVELPRLSGRVKQRIIHPIPHEQIKILENNLSEEKEKIQLLLSYYCGLRLGELMKIKILSFNWEAWGKDVEKMGECRVYGKGDKEGIALVPAAIMKRIGNYIKSKNFKSIDSTIFIKPGERVNVKNRSRLWQYKLREAGLKAQITQLDGQGKAILETVVHPHRLRHSYATHLLNDLGLDSKEVQELLRHTSIQSTQIYLHINKEKLKEKLKDM